MKAESEMKPFQEQTLYELLEISTSASDDEIRAAYDHALELYGPDSVAIYALEDPSQAEELRARLKRAREILSDADLRDEYDRSIGLIPPRPDPDEEPEDEPAQLAMSEVLATAEAVHSTRPELSVSYIPPPAEQARPVEPTRSEPAAAIETLAEVPPIAEPSRLPEPPKPEVRAQRALESAPEMSSEDAIASAESAMAQVAAKARESRPKPIDIPADAEFNGELLRRIRESRGLTIAQVADRTRISARHLENVEADRYAALPPVVYLRGIMMNLAREYQLDPIRVSKSYMTLAKK